LAVIDLAVLLDRLRQIKNVSVIGRVVGKLPKPDNIFDNVVCDCDFYKFECLAVQIPSLGSFFKNNYVRSASGWYFVNGDLLVSGSEQQPDGWYFLTGTAYRGIKAGGVPSYYNMFKYRKTEEGVWHIEPVYFDPPDVYDTKISRYLSQDTEVLTVPEACDGVRLFSASLTSMPQRIYEDLPMPVEETDDFVPVCRDHVLPASPRYVAFKEALHEANIKYYKFSNSLKDKYSISDDNAIKSLVERLLANRTQGSYVVEQCLDGFQGTDKEVEGMSISRYLARRFDECSKLLLNPFAKIKIYNKKALDLALELFNDKESIYAGLIAAICGISVPAMLGVVEKIGYKPSSYIPDNPYLLSLLGGMSQAATERVAAAFNKNNDASIEQYRGASYATQLFDDNSSISDSGTLCPTSVLNNVGFTVTENQLLHIRSTGCPFGNAMSNRVQMFLGNRVHYDINEFTNRVRRESNVLGYFVDFGLGCVVDSLITSRKLLMQELFIHDAMYACGSTLYDYDPAQIDSLIDEYQDMKGITLEKRQREAVHLCRFGGALIQGGAGSGKTTTSECLVYVLEQLDPGIDIRFAAPTGRAAKRLQEVTHHEAKTLHREFRLFDFSEEDEPVDNVVYLIDEGAMISLDLMYKSLRRMGNGCRVFLIGDYDQLPPIGRGMPFKDLLRFMPCVVLNVSKRAAAGSMITYNSTLICDGRSNLQNGKDFLMISASLTEIADTVADICRKYLKLGGSMALPDIPGITPDDIQIVTPYRDKSYVGATYLNDKLEPLFNRLPNTAFTIGNQMFKVGDRVVHSDSNKYKMRWYESTGAFSYKTIGTQAGVTNGDVGVVKDVISTASISLEVDEESDDLRDDRSFTGSNRFFIIVEYPDLVGGGTFCILYRALAAKGAERCKNYFGEDTGYLNLFYAGTTHKMQGSEAKLVICVLPGVFSRKGFMTREMLNTMITRGKSMVFLVGAKSKLPDIVADRSSAGCMTVGKELVCDKKK